MGLVFALHFHLGLYLLTHILSFDLRYMARRIGAPYLSDVVKGRPQAQAQPQGSRTQSAILNYL